MIKKSVCLYIFKKPRMEKSLKKQDMLAIKE